MAKSDEKDADEFTSTSNSGRKRSTIVGVVILFLSWWFRSLTSSSLPSIPTHLEPSQFHAHRARQYLESITSIGPRVTGTDNLENKATRVLLDTLRQIKMESASNPDLFIDIEVQHPSSFFYLDFLGGLMNVYNNITNVIVKVSWKSSVPNEEHSILLNSHYDTISGSSGASDDAVGVACMLETIRAISRGPSLHQPIIFLFNGAEESLMQGAHGFITQHKWAANIQYIINLEAMGAGGKEMVFQCNSQWMASFYTNHAKYPNANVLANEIFTNLLSKTAATDFRTFLSHGPPGMVGVDSAYTLNGYVYHTSFDSIKAVPDETLQHTGENLLSLTTALSLNKDYPPRAASSSSSSSTYLPSTNRYLPSSIPAAQAVYFDLFAWSVIYTGGYTITLIHTFIFLLGLYTAYQLFQIIMTTTPSTTISSHQHNLSYFFKHLLISLWNEFFCIFLCLLVVIVLSFLYASFIPMLWYDRGLLIAFILYIPPTLLTSILIRSRYSQHYSQTQGILNILSMWLFFLSLSIIFNIMVGYIACLHIISIWAVFVFTKMINDYMTHRAPLLGYDRSRLILFMSSYSYEICQLPILYIWWCIFSPTFVMLIPLMGKVGTVILSDVLVALVIGFGISTGWNILNVQAITKGQPSFPFLLKTSLGYLFVVLILSLTIESYSPTHPKRLWIQHVYREHHPLSPSNDEEKLIKIDHGLWISGFDEKGLDPIIPYLSSTTYHRNLLSPRFANLATIVDVPLTTFDYSCNGWTGDCYFQYPYSFPVAEALQDYIYIPRNEPPQMIHYQNKLTLDITLLSSKLALDDEIPTYCHQLRSYPKNTGLIKRINSLTLTGSSHMTLVLRELPGAHLIRWAFPQQQNQDNHEKEEEKEIIDWNNSTVIKRSDGIFYIQIGFGNCHPKNICQQRVYLESIDESEESKIEIAAYSHYMGEERDEPIEEFIHSLPDWSKGAEWSQYQSAIIVKYA